MARQPAWIAVLFGVVSLWGLDGAWPQDGPKAARRLIIHADDAGMSHSANRATIEAIEKGIVTSTSILVPCAWFPEFAAYARAHPQGDYGIHLTLTCEWKNYRWGPVAPRDKVPSLLDRDGYLWRDNGPVAAHAKLSEAETELRAQIERARAFGVPLSHLDTHMGTLLSRPDFLELYVNLGIEYNLPIMFPREATSVALEARYPALRGQSRNILEALDRRSFPVLDSVRMLYEKGEHGVRKRRYLDAFAALPQGVSEIIVHCGFANEELRAITDSAELRDSDRQIMTDPSVKAELEKLGISPTNWRQFRADTAAKK